MSKRLWTTWLAPPAAAALAVVLFAAVAIGQARKMLRLTPPLTPASNFGGRLGSHSFGLGGLHGGRAWSNSGPLRTTLYDIPRFGIARLPSRAHRSPYAAPAPLGARPRSRLVAPPPKRVPIPFRIGPPSIKPTKTAPGTAISAKLDGSPAHSSATVMNVTQAYVQAVRSAAGLQQADATASEITSLVPQESGLYRLYMYKGEQALRRGDIAKAAGQFRIAYDVGRHRPESLLALCHVRCIAGSYAMASYHLQRALRALPELPLTPLRPAILLGGEKVYNRVMRRLAGYVGRHPEDPEGHLLQAYFTWFEDGPQAARAALARAEIARKRSLAARKHPEQGDLFLEAVGTLQSALPPAPTTMPATRPTPTTRPAR